MKKIIYTPDYKEKVKKLREYMDSTFGDEVRAKAMTELNNRIQLLKKYERSGISVREALGVDSNYFYIYVIKNYVFYSIKEEEIVIINIYNEREDFMWKLFGIKTISPETEEYWNE